MFNIVFIAVPPSISPQSQTLFVSSGNPALLPCNYSGYPTPSVYWTVTHSGTPTNVTKGETVHLLTIADGTTQSLTAYENGTLYISAVDHMDSKVQYQCTAMNRLGTAKGDVHLTVVGGMTFCLILTSSRRWNLCSH